MSDILYNSTIDNIRYYKNIKPSISDLVSVEIISYTEIGVTCYLTEYKIEGFMYYKDFCRYPNLLEARYAFQYFQFYLDS